MITDCHIHNRPVVEQMFQYMGMNGMRMSDEDVDFEVAQKKYVIVQCLLNTCFC